MEKQKLSENIAIIKNKMKQACEKSERNINDITFVAVTKTVNTQTMQSLLDLGITNVGENRVLIAKEKYENMPGNNFIWHMIGNLQTKKVKTAISMFDVFHSVDSVKLAKEISKHSQWPKKIFLQVNISKEESKSGFFEDELEQKIHQIAELENIDVCGLMTMAPFVDDMEICRKCFSDTRLLSERLRDKGYITKNRIELSMGMSRDFEIAIEEGATIIRVGSAIYQY